MFQMFQQNYVSVKKKNTFLQTPLPDYARLPPLRIELA